MALRTDQKILIEQRVTNETKSMAAAYFFWLFFGGIGAHRFYLGRAGSAFAQIVLLFGGLVALLMGAGKTSGRDGDGFVMIFYAMVAIGGMWIFIDAFLIPSMIKEDHDDIRSRLEEEMQSDDAH